MGSQIFPPFCQFVISQLFEVARPSRLPGFAMVNQEAKSKRYKDLSSSGRSVLKVEQATLERNQSGS